MVAISLGWATRPMMVVALTVSACSVGWDRGVDGPGGDGVDPDASGAELGGGEAGLAPVGGDGINDHNVAGDVPPVHDDFGTVPAQRVRGSRPMPEVAPVTRAVRPSRSRCLFMARPFG
jgi:hypothetical protein